MSDYVANGDCVLILSYVFRFAKPDSMNDQINYNLWLVSLSTYAQTYVIFHRQLILIPFQDYTYLLRI